jgi:DNA ligase-1
VQLGELVRASERVRAVPGRREKVRELAACLARLGPDEVRTGAAFLAGELPEGWVGIGPAAAMFAG